MVGWRELAAAAADLERGWLTVAALDPDNPTRLTDYSQACGIAMNYCLAAPGDVIFIVGGTLPFLWIAFQGVRNFRHGKTVHEFPEDVLYTELHPSKKKGGWREEAEA